MFFRNAVPSVPLGWRGWGPSPGALTLGAAGAQASGRAARPRKSSRRTYRIVVYAGALLGPKKSGAFAPPAAESVRVVVLVCGTPTKCPLQLDQVS